MMKNLLILKRYLRIAFCNLTHSRVNLFGLLFYWFVSLSVLIIFWQALFQYLPAQIGIWDFPKLCILNSICYISWGIFVFFWGLHQIPQKVISGELDKFLARPISPLLGLIGEEIRFIALYEIIAGIISATIFSYYYEIPITLVKTAFASACLLLGTLIMVLVHGCISLSSFWFGRIDSLQQIIDSMDEFQKYPLSFYPKNFRWFLFFVIPLYFPGSLTAQVFLDMPIPAIEWVFFAFAFCFWLAAFLLLYRKCLYHYEANG